VKIAKITAKTRHQITGPQTIIQWTSVRCADLRCADVATGKRQIWMRTNIRLLPIIRSHAHRLICRYAQVYRIQELHCITSLFRSESSMVFSLSKVPYMELSFPERKFFREKVPAFNRTPDCHWLLLVTPKLWLKVTAQPTDWGGGTAPFSRLLTQWVGNAIHHPHILAAPEEPLFLRLYSCAFSGRLGPLTQILDPPLLQTYAIQIRLHKTQWKVT